MDNNEPKLPSFFRFEDLRVYHKAIEFSVWINHQVKEFPADKQEVLGRKLEMAAYNVALQIAEGSSRNKGNFVSFLKIAKSSVRDCVVLTAIAQKLELLDEEKYKQSTDFLIELTKMVGALIASLQKSGIKESSPRSISSESEISSEGSDLDFDF